MIFKNNIVSKFTYLFIIIIICSSCMSRTETKDDVATAEITNMTFKQQEHDFGKIPVGKSATAVFKFSNTGNNPLLIKEVNTSCGCTVPEWPKEVMKPNEKGEIKIVYDAKFPGHFNKTITVFYNGKKSPQELTIKGEVPYPKEKSSSNKIN